MWSQFRFVEPNENLLCNIIWFRPRGCVFHVRAIVGSIQDGKIPITLSVSRVVKSCRTLRPAFFRLLDSSVNPVVAPTVWRQKWAAALEVPYANIPGVGNKAAVAPTDTNSAFGLT